MKNQSQATSVQTKKPYGHCLFHFKAARRTVRFTIEDEADLNRWQDFYDKSFSNFQLAYFVRYDGLRIRFQRTPEQTRYLRMNREEMREALSERQFQRDLMLVPEKVYITSHCTEENAPKVWKEYLARKQQIRALPRAYRVAYYRGEFQLQ